MTGVQLMDHGIARTRAKNKAAQRRASTVQCIEEHLAFFGVLVVRAHDRHEPFGPDVLHAHAEKIVNAVDALLYAKEPS